MTKTNSINLKDIKLLILDVDGVLTDGGIILHPDGSESKIFNTQDGHGIRLIQRAGVEVAIISGRETAVTSIRAKQLGIEHIHQNCHKKLPVFEQLIDELKIAPENIAYVGDDTLDMPLVKRAGLGVAVANAVDELKEIADYVTKKSGGNGAVREVVEYILKGSGRWASLMERYTI